MAPAVKPYTPSRRVAWETAPLRAPLRIGCGGDFEDPELNVEMRRFLWRDVAPTTCYVGCFLSALLFLLAMFVDETSPTAFDIARQAFKLGLFAVAAFGDTVAYVCRSNQHRTTSLLRLVGGVIFAVGFAAHNITHPVAAVLTCGPVDRLASNDTSVAAAAVAERQQFCIDVVSPWQALTAFCIICAVRVYPQHGIPIVFTQFILDAVGFAFRPAPTDDNPYEVHPGAIATHIAVQAVICVSSVVFSVRLHSTQRARFIAAADAERARRLALSEMRCVDALLKRTLPHAVLWRVDRDRIDEHDAADEVAVLLSDVPMLGARAAEVDTRDAAIAVVTELHALVAAYDDLLPTTGPLSVVKVKTIGDVYCAVSGLPRSCPCHASEISRFAREMLSVSVQVLKDVGVDTPSGRSESRADDLDGFDDGHDHRDNSLGRGGPAAAVPSWASSNQVGGISSGGGSSRTAPIRIGVHVGPACGGVLGTQRLSYDVYGDGFDGAEAALACARTGIICITHAVKQRLAVEAALYGSDADSRALFGSAADVEDNASEVVADAAHGAVVFYALTGESAALSGLRHEPIARSRSLRQRDESACTVTAVTTALAAGTNDLSSCDRRARQRAKLEQRLGFVLRRALDSQGGPQALPVSRSAPTWRVPAVVANAAPEQMASPLDSSVAMTPRIPPVVPPTAADRLDVSTDPEDSAAMYQAPPQPPSTTHSNSRTPTAQAAVGSPLAGRVGADRSATSDPATTPRLENNSFTLPAAPAPTFPLASSSPDALVLRGDEARAPEQLATLEDADNGPFARRSSVPLVYTFADPDEEKGYNRFARDASYVLRRDIRICTAVLAAVVLACRLAVEADSDGAPVPPVVSVVLLGASFGLAVFNAVLLARRPTLHADTALAYTTFYVLTLGVLTSFHAHPLANDPFWLCGVHTMFLDATAWTLSPLVRAALHTLLIATVCIPMAIARKGEYRFALAIALTAIVVLPMLKAVLESLSRGAYIETRLSAALAAQRDAAKTARDAMLRSVVPAHAIAPLRASLANETEEAELPDAPTKPALADYHDNVAVAFLTFCDTSSVDMVDTIDAGVGAAAAAKWLVEAHNIVDALLERCATVTKVKSAGARVLLAGPFFGAGAKSTQGPPTVAHTLADIFLIVSTLGQLGVSLEAAVSVGPVAGLIVGRVRLSYDILGPAVKEVRAVAATLRRDVEPAGSPGKATAVPRCAVGMTEAAANVLRKAPAMPLGLGSAADTQTYAVSRYGRAPAPKRAPPPRSEDDGDIEMTPVGVIVSFESPSDTESNGAGCVRVTNLRPVS